MGFYFCCYFCFSEFHSIILLEWLAIFEQLAHQWWVGLSRIFFSFGLSGLKPLKNPSNSIHQNLHVPVFCGIFSHGSCQNLDTWENLNVILNDRKCIEPPLHNKIWSHSRRVCQSNIYLMVHPIKIGPTRENGMWDLFDDWLVWWLNFWFQPTYPHYLLLIFLSTFTWWKVWGHNLKVWWDISPSVTLTYLVCFFCLLSKVEFGTIGIGNGTHFYQE